MSNKLFSKATFTAIAIAIAVVASTASIGSAQAGGYGGGHGWGHGHGHGHNKYYGCRWVYKKVWSNYHYRYITKKFRVCH